MITHIIDVKHSGATTKSYNSFSSHAPIFAFYDNSADVTTHEITSAVYIKSDEKIFYYKVTGCQKLIAAYILTTCIIIIVDLR